MNVLDFGKRKHQGKKISMVTCNDFWSAQLINESPSTAFSLAIVSPWPCTALTRQSTQIFRS
jgi:hypothetical protein